MTLQKTLLLAFLLTPFVLAACGGDDPATTPTKGAGPTVKAIVPPAATVVGVVDMEVDSATGFGTAAFPPTMKPEIYHEDSWTNEACLECHLTGEDEAPKVEHKGMPEILKKGACRSCHVLEPEEGED